MIDDIQHKVLLACKKYDRNPLSLIRDFGEEVYKAIDRLEELNYLKLEHGAGYSGGQIYYTLTEAGRSFINNYCHACECIPCDCGYGS